MYCLPVNPTIECYHQNSIINKNAYFKAAVGSYYFEYYEAEPSEALPHQIKEENDEFFFSEYTQAEIDSLIKQFEEKFKMTSEEFIKLHAVGKVPDACEIMLWEAFLGLE